LNVGFLGFFPETCLSGHDNKADTTATAVPAKIPAI
jgi:hypothetical protein